MKKLDLILLIEDNRATSYFNKVILEDMGVCKQVGIVCDGEEGIEYLKRNCTTNQEISTDKCPDLILLDINMHGMNGFDFLDIYQNLSSSQKGNSTIIVLTSSELEEEKVKVKSYKDVKGFLHKPLTEEKISNIIDEYF